MPTPAQKMRAQKIYRELGKRYPDAHIALKYKTPIQLLAAVVMSAQCTDKKVNEITAELFKTYKTLDDFADAKIAKFEKEIRQCGFYRQKAKNIIASARMIRDDFGGRVPRTTAEITKPPGAARKSGNVILGNVYR